MYNQILSIGDTEPVTVEEVKIQARYDLDVTAEDELIAEMISSARELCEFKLQRSIIDQVRQVVLAGFPADGCIELAWPNVRSISSVKYMDVNGVEQTLHVSQYELINFKPNASAILVRKPNVIWPATKSDALLSVWVEYACGYEDADSTPSGIKRWIKAVCATVLKHRESVTSGDRAVRELPDNFCHSFIGRYKVWGL